MRDGIWLEVSRVRIEGKNVAVQVVGDKRDDKPEWWPLELDALGVGDGRQTYNAIATGLDKSDQVVIAKLDWASANSFKSAQDVADTLEKATATKPSEPEKAAIAKLDSDFSGGLTCTSIRIQTT